MISCKYLLEGKGIGRVCVKDENCSCRYWGMKPWCEEQEMKIIFDDDDGEIQ
jgi:hypothetical protein